MGNASRKFLDEPGWEDYERQPWRSERARELDRLGGMERATIKRGDSFNQKMKFLGASAGSQANHMETVLRGSVDSGTGKPRVARGLAHHDSAKMAVNASLLAQYRDPASWQSPAPVSPPHHQQLRTSASHNPTSSSVSVASSGRVSNGGGGNGGSGSGWGKSTDAAAEAAKKAEVRKKMMAYGSNLSKQNSVRERSSLDADATRVAAGIRADNTASGPLVAAKCVTKVAPWRNHIYQARRRVFLIVMTAVRLKSLVKSHNHKQRMHRVDSFSLYINKVLGSALPRFVQEQERCTEALAELEAIHLVLTHAADELTEEPLHQSRGCFLHLHAHELEGTAVLEEGEEGAVYVTSDGRRINRMTEIPTNLSSPGVPQALHPKNLNPKTLGPELTDQPNRVLPRGAHEAAGEALRSHSNSRLRTAARDEEAGLHEDLTGVLTDLMEEVNRPRTSVPETRSAEITTRAMVRGPLDLPSLCSESSADLPPRNTALRRSLPGLNPSQSHSPIHTPVGATTPPRLPPTPLEDRYGETCRFLAGPDCTALATKLLHSVSGLSESARGEQLTKEKESRNSAVEHAGMLLAMYVNRGNAAWAAAQQWGPPQLFTLANWVGSGDHEHYLRKLEEAIHHGQVAVQLFASEDYVVNKEGDMLDLWVSDPWALVEECRPGKMTLTDDLENLPMGTRLLVQLVSAVEVLGGPEGVARLKVVLHVGEHQQTEVLSDLLDRSFYGMDPSNVIIITQPEWPGYRYDHETGTFRRDPTSQSHSLGTGYSMMKLHWVGEGQTMSAEGTWTPLPGSALETLMSKGVKWMLSHRARDLSLLTAEGAFDKDLLAYAMSLHTKEDINMAMHAIQTDSNVISRHHDSLILSPKTAPSASRETPARSQVKASCELRYSELVNPALTPKLSAAKAAQNGALITGMDRYVFHLPSLHALLVGFPLQPGLRLSGDTVHVSWDIANLFRLSGARAVPILSSRPVDVLMHAEDCEFLVPVLSKQDHDTCFRRTLSRFASKRRVSTMVQSADHNELEPVVVLVPNISHITDIAVTMAMMGVRPGKDLLQLVSVARDHSYVDGAKAVLKHYEEIALRCMARVTTEVLVQTPWNLIEVLDWHVNQLQAKLVVAGSNELTASAELRSHHVVNSVAFAILRRLSVPVLLVTANTKLPGFSSSANSMHAVALAEHYSQPMVKFLSRMLDQARGDRMTIAQMVPAHFISKQQRINYGLVLESFVDMVTKLRIPVHKSEQLPLPMRNSLLALLNTERSSIVGVQMPPGGRISNDLLSLLRSSHAGVLVYKRHA